MKNIAAGGRKMLDIFFGIGENFFLWTAKNEMKKR
jgi:hypothetical protein